MMHLPGNTMGKAQKNALNVKTFAAISYAIGKKSSACRTYFN